MDGVRNELLTDCGRESYFSFLPYIFRMNMYSSVSSDGKMKPENIETKEVIRERWNRSSQQYDREGHSDREKEAWKSLLTRALGTEKLKVLDVGCGTGVVALLLSEMGHDVNGVDISEGMLKKANEKINAFNLPIEFTLGDAENLPFENELFDTVINRHLLWTLPNPKNAISEWRRVLKPGGKIVIIDGCWDDHKRLHKQIWRYLISIPLISIIERRNPWHGHYFYGRDIEKKLPMWNNKKRPEADIEILKNFGFSVDVTNVKIPRTQTFLEYLKYGLYSAGPGYFLIEGIKWE